MPYATFRLVSGGIDRNIPLQGRKEQITTISRRFFPILPNRKKKRIFCVFWLTEFGVAAGHLQSKLGIFYAFIHA
jgi:hypothetical protein